MTKLTTISRLARLTTVLAASVALIAIVDSANAKGNSNHGDNAHSHGAASHFAANGQSHNEKRMSDHHNKIEKKKDKYAKKKKDCEKIIVPTPGCAISPKDPVGSVHTGGITGGNKSPAPPSQAGGGTGTKGPSPGATTVTLSNGVTTSAIENGKGITVTSNSPGMITVSNGNGSVTMPGGSVTLHGALSVSVPAGMQLVHLTNGDVSVAVGPILMGGSSQSRPVPPGVTFGDDVKAVGAAAGNGAAMAVTSLVVVPGSAVTMVGSVVASPFTGHPVKFIENSANEIVNMGGKAIEWASNLF